MSTLKSPDASERPTHGTPTMREPGTGRIYTILPSGRRVYEPEGSPLTTWPSEPGQSKVGK
jgi:hypothetical protein